MLGRCQPRVTSGLPPGSLDWRARRACRWCKTRGTRRARRSISWGASPFFRGHSRGCRSLMLGGGSAVLLDSCNARLCFRPPQSSRPRAARASAALVAQWIAYQTSDLTVAGSSPVEGEFFRGGRLPTPPKRHAALEKCSGLLPDFQRPPAARKTRETRVLCCRPEPWKLPPHLDSGGPCAVQQLSTPKYQHAFKRPYPPGSTS